jgi:hypothetical protein
VYGSADWIAKHVDPPREKQRDAWLIHGCDGCCGDIKWKIESLQESVCRSNDIIHDLHQLIARLRAQEEEHE